jgi:hypothetical protein
MNYVYVFILFLGIAMTIIGIQNYIYIYKQYGEHSIERDHITAQLATSYGVGIIVIASLVLVLQK